MSVSASLFDPVGEGSIQAAGVWLANLLTGSLATTLCIIAVATLGLLMLWGEVPVRRGVQVILGCFVLLSATTVAAALQDLGSDLAGNDQAPVPLVIEQAPPPPLPPASYDPYAGASLRRR